MSSNQIWSSSEDECHPFVYIPIMFTLLQCRSSSVEPKYMCVWKVRQLCMIATVYIGSASIAHTRLETIIGISWKFQLEIKLQDGWKMHVEW